MKRAAVVGLVASVCLLGGLTGRALADEVLVTVDGSKGPFPADDGPGAVIAALSADYEVVSPTAGGSAGGGAGAGKVQHKGFVLRKTPGASSAFFYEALVTGEHLSKVTVTFKKKGKGGKGDKQDYLIVTLNDVIVTGYQLSGPPGADEAPIENIALVFARIQYTHPPSGKTVISALDGRI